MKKHSAKGGASVSGIFSHRLQNSDADAFTELCAPFEGMVYRHCLQMLRNPTDAQDAAQETMLRAYRGIRAFREGSGVGTWLYRIAHNVCLDWLKRPQARMANASLNELAESGFDPPDEGPTPEDAYLAASERDALAGAISALPDELQALLTLRYGDRLSYEQLADILKLNVGTVKSKLNRAKEKLRALLPEHGWND
jgi:RNA polymerase sigma-70 factor, ECF subfamily